jgi:predicted enzyme related to lactoylglutathione lyase
MCTDVSAGSRFYTGLFGWTTAEVKVMGATVLRLLRGQEAIGAIIPFDPRFGLPSHWVPYMSVESVEDCCTRIGELGGEVCMGATQFPPGRFAVVHDPQKAMFSPFTPKDGLPVATTRRPGAGAFCWDDLLTSDPQGAAKFYGALLGWGSMAWDGGGAERHALLTPGGVPLGGILGLPREAAHPPMWLSYVCVEDAVASAARAETLGGKIVTAPADIPVAGRCAVLRDPSGASIGILQPGARG